MIDEIFKKWREFLSEGNDPERMRKLHQLDPSDQDVTRKISKNSNRHNDFESMKKFLDESFGVYGQMRNNVWSAAIHHVLGFPTVVVSWRGEICVGQVINRLSGTKLFSSGHKDLYDLVEEMRTEMPNLFQTETSEATNETR